jgi:hypothetical protein
MIHIKKSVNSCLYHLIIYYHIVTKVAFDVICYFSLSRFFFSMHYFDSVFVHRLYKTESRLGHLLSSAGSLYSQQMKRSIEFVRTHINTIVMVSPTYVIISSECYAHRERKGVRVTIKEKSRK